MFERKGVPLPHRLHALAAGLLCVLLGGCGGSVATSPIVAAPTAAPTGAASAIIPSAASVTFGASNAPQTITVSEPGYGGTFTAVSANTAVATVTQVSASSIARSADARETAATTTATFTITPVGGGTTTVTISDSEGHSVSIAVSVTGATLIPQSAF
jgi:hypothetical protein